MARKDRHKPTPVTCPECKQIRMVKMETFLNPNFTGVCGHCAKTGNGNSKKREVSAGKSSILCLKCERYFPSKDRVNNRLCPKCQLYNERTSEEEVYLAPNKRTPRPAP